MQADRARATTARASPSSRPRASPRGAAARGAPRATREGEAAAAFSSTEAAPTRNTALTRQAARGAADTARAEAGALSFMADLFLSVSGGAQSVQDTQPSTSVPSSAACRARQARGNSSDGYSSRNSGQLCRSPTKLARPNKPSPPRNPTYIP